MHEEYDFHGKERHYKTLLLRGQTDYPSKRLRRDEYQAMATVAQAYPSQDVVFKARRGARPVTITVQQIHKELGRCRKPDNASSSSPRLDMSEPQAKALLSAKGIGFDIIGVRKTTQHMDCPALIVEAPLSPDGSDSSASVATPIETPATPFGLAGSLTSYFSSHMPTGLEPGHSGQLSLAGMDMPMVPQPLHESSNPYEYCLFYPGVNSNECWMPPSNANTFGRSPDERPILPRPTIPLNRKKQKTYEWAHPFYMDSFGTGNTTQHDINTLKVQAIQHLRDILEPASENQYILPCLNEVVTVLGANEKWSQLTEFLRESTQVVDEHSPLATPFRYALAACVHDAEAKEKYGSMMRQGHDDMVPRYGRVHPNILVNSYYHAYHLLDSGQYEPVIFILKVRLLQALQVLRGQNLMIVNCMAMLGRAYAMANDHREACKKYNEALQSLCNHPYLSAYRLGILIRLAMSQAKLDEMGRAEDNMREAIDGRIDIFGYSSRLTWAAIETFEDILRDSGRGEQAEQVRSYHALKYHRQQQLQWYIKKNIRPIPADLMDPPEEISKLRSVSMPIRSRDPPLRSPT